jgi:uncharacterized membrane protein YfcA
MFDPQYLWLFYVLVALGAFSQGFTGIGFGIIILAGVAFTPWNFERSTVVVNLLALFLNMILIYASRRDARVNWVLVGYILLGSAVGVPLGYWFIVAFGDRPLFRLVFGATLATFAANELFRPKIRNPLPKPAGLVAGVMGGFLNGAFTAAGPPIALFVYSQHKEPTLLKGTLQLLFLTTNIWRILNIMLFGKGISLPIVKLSALALPIVLGLTFIGHLASRRVSSRTFLRVVYTLIAFAGVMQIAKGLKGIF